MKPTVVVGPTRVDGTILRLVSDGEWSWVEEWSPSGWRTGGGTVDEVLKGPPASPEALAARGIPREDWVQPGDDD